MTTAPMSGFLASGSDGAERRMSWVTRIERSCASPTPSITTAPSQQQAFDDSFARSAKRRSQSVFKGTSSTTIEHTQHQQQLLASTKRSASVSATDFNKSGTGSSNKPPIDEDTLAATGSKSRQHRRQAPPAQLHPLTSYGGAGLPWVTAATMVGHFRPRFEHGIQEDTHIRATVPGGLLLPALEESLPARASSVEPQKAGDTLRSKSSLHTPSPSNRVASSSPLGLTNGSFSSALGMRMDESLLAQQAGSIASLPPEMTTAEDQMIKDLLANSPRRFQVPDWSTMDPFTAAERGIIEELSRCRASPALYAQGFESKMEFVFPIDMMGDEFGEEGVSEPSSPTSPALDGGDAGFCSALGTPLIRKEDGQMHFSGAEVARHYLEGQHELLQGMHHQLNNPLSATEGEDSGKDLKKKRGRQRNLVVASEDDNEFEEQNMRCQAKLRHIEQCQQLLEEQTTFLDRLKHVGGPSGDEGLPKAGYNRGLCLAAREIASQLGKDGKRTLSLTDQLAQYGKLTGEIAEYVVYGVMDPLETVEAIVTKALKGPPDDPRVRVLLYPTKLYAGAGWQKHARRGAVTVVILASGFQEISYIKKHRNLPIVELKRCMSLGQMTADERLYDLNFIPEHYGIRALRPVAHPVMCGARLELVLQCPPHITLSCATEVGNDISPCQSQGTTFVDRIGRTAKINVVMLELKPCKLVVYARHPNELVYKKASTVLLRPVKQLWRVADAQPFPVQLEQFQVVQGELITPRKAPLVEDGVPVNFVVRFLGVTKSCVLRGSHGSTELVRGLQSRGRSILGASFVAPSLQPQPQSQPQQIPSSPSPAGGSKLLPVVKSATPNSPISPVVVTNRTPTTYMGAVVTKVGPLSLWVDDLCVLQWEVVSAAQNEK